MSNPPYDQNNPFQQPQNPYQQPQQPYQQYPQQQPWPQQPYQQPYGQQYIPPYNPFIHTSPVDLPNANNAQVMGIIGIVLFWNIIGIVLNIIAITQGSTAMNEYQRNPGRYTEDSFRRAKTGKTCGTIGLSLLGFAILFVIFLVAINT